MPQETVIKADRRAAGATCMILFGINNGIAHALHQLARVHPISNGMFGKGLTPNEREYVNKLATKYHENGETLRKLGQRLLK